MKEKEPGIIKKVNPESLQKIKEIYEERERVDKSGKNIYPTKIEKGRSPQEEIDLGRLVKNFFKGCR